MELRDILGTLKSNFNLAVLADKPVNKVVLESKTIGYNNCKLNSSMLVSFKLFSKLFKGVFA